MIKTIAFTVYPVDDLEKAQAFYRDAVGLGEPKMLHDRWAEFDVGGTTFALVTGAESLGTPAGSAFSVAFETSDFDAAVARLRSSGAKVEEPFEVPTCRAVFARDIDGNRFGLHQLKDRPSSQK